jgi:predicted lipoprotein with Yx(FWY)xxD motif
MCTSSSNIDSEAILRPNNLKTLGITLAVAALPMLIMPAHAQNDTKKAAIVAKGMAPETDPYLTDGQGRTLYTLVADDEENQVNCDAKCLENWEPYMTTDRPLGHMVLPGLLGTMEENGKNQVTYRGKPLYLFKGDKNPGDMKGQGFNEVGYMVTVVGEPVLPQANIAAAGPVQPEVMAAGGKIFETTCAMCHGAQGQGAFGTKLAGFDRLADGRALARTIVFGQNSMPALGAALSDEQVAAVSTYVRNSWGNEFGAMSAEQVKSVR